MHKQNILTTILNKLESENLIIEVENPKDIALHNTAYYKTAGENSLCFYAGDDPYEISHLNNCILICSNDIDQYPKSVTCIKTNNITSWTCFSIKNRL